MAETLILTCDRCKARISKADRTRVKWATQPFRREPTDLCPACTSSMLAAFGFNPRPTYPMIPNGVAS